MNVILASDDKTDPQDLPNRPENPQPPSNDSVMESVKDNSIQKDNHKSDN